MSVKIFKIERKKLPLSQRIYLWQIILGLKRTLSHFYKNFKDTSNLEFIEYPEQKPKDITPRYRGLHRLLLDEQGELKCVACEMCASACPAKCISIEASERDNAKEKIPVKFDIDLLECVYCGFCVEACPKDAIRMDSGLFVKTGYKREDFLISLSELAARKGGF